MFSSSSSRFFAAAALTLLAGAAASAVPVDPQGQPQQPPQAGERIWWSFDGSPEGTPPTIVASPQSTPDATVLDVDMHGVWIEGVLREGTLFHEVRFPDSKAQAGDPTLPSLPALGGTIAIPTNSFGNQQGSVLVLEQQQIPLDLKLPPVQPVGQSHPPDANGNVPEEPFLYDPAIYQMPVPYQTQPITLSRVVRDSGVPLQSFTISPATYVPAARNLLISTEMTVTIQHPGELLEPVELDRRAASRFTDFVITGPFIPWHVNPGSFDGLYIIVVDTDWEDTVEPLADLKRRQGYQVEIINQDRIGGTVPLDERIRLVIQSVYNQNFCGGTAYVLLAGDVVDLPMYAADGPLGNIIPSDAAYGWIDGDDRWPEAFVGRLSASTEEDLARQIDHVVDYQINPPSDDDFYYNSQLNVAAYQERGRFVERLEDLAFYDAYADDPIMAFLNGRQHDHNEYDIVNILNAGVGTAMYAGHGNRFSWAAWHETQSDDRFNVNDVRTRLTTTRDAPVILSAACLNSSLDGGSCGEDAHPTRTDFECMAEAWMNEEVGYAVAHYGYSRCSYHPPSHWMLQRYAKALYGDLRVAGGARPAVRLGNLIWKAQRDAYVRDASSESYRDTVMHNWTMGILLGDPSMKVWTEEPERLSLFGVNDLLSTGSVIVNDASGTPAADVLVTVTVDGEPVANAYTDAGGLAVFDLADIVAFASRSASTIELHAHAETGMALDVSAAVQMTPCPADLNGDTIVDAADLASLIGSWGLANVAADIDGSGAVDASDLAALIGAWGPCS